MLVREKDLLPGRATVLRLPAGRGAAREHAGRLLPSRRAVATVLALAVVLAAGYWAARLGPFFALRDVRVRGAPPALAGEVRSAVAPLRGRSLLALDGREVIDRVQALPEVAAASYDRAFPRALVVTVRREVPRAVVRQGRASWLASARGRVVRPVRRGSHGRLPRIWVGRSVSLRLGSLIGDPVVRRSVDAIGPLGDHPLPVAVRSVDSRGPLVFRLANGVELRLGSGADLAVKLAVAAEVLRLLEPPHPRAAVYVDVSVPERPVAASTVKSKIEPEG